MGGSFISSWLRMVFSAATFAKSPLTVDRSNFANRSASGQRGGIAQAKREALKAKRRKAHKRRVR